MMLNRAWRAEFDLTESEGRIISGIAVPFDSPTRIAENGRVFDETFKAGSVRDSIRKRGDRMRILGFHDSRSWPIGRPVEMADTKRGFELAFRASDTQAGNDALTLVRDGAIDGFSVGFGVPEGGETWNRDMTERTITRADIHEVSLVNFPAYDRARVESVRMMSVAVDETLAHGGPEADGDGAGPHNYTDPHQFNNIVGTGLCAMCNMTDADGNHTNQNAAGIDLSQRYTLEVARLELLRLA